MRHDRRASARIRTLLIGASMSTGIVAGTAATALAQQYYGPGNRYDARPSYRPAPSPSPSPSPSPGYAPAPGSATTRTVPSPQPQAQQGYRPASPQAAPVQSAQPQAAPPRPAAAAEPSRRPQQPAAAGAQAAAACMNDGKSTQPDIAIRSCNAIIDETAKNLANAYFFRGAAKADKNDFDGAIGDYAQAIALDPADPDYLNRRAAAYEAKNDLDKALADYNQAIKLDPKSTFAYNNRGAAYQRKGDFARAASDYGEVTRLQPGNADAWSARCWVRAVSPGQTQQALSDCDAALKIKADAPDVLDTRGFVYLKLSQYDNAIRDYDAALKLDPKLAASLYGRGVAKTRKGDRSGGTTDMNAARTIRADVVDEFARYGVRP